MSTHPRWVVIDDTNAGIVYNGSWVADVGSLNNIGNFGPPYLNTLHGTNSSASLSFNFSGTRVRAWGTNYIRNDSGVIDPKWECFVDQVSIGASAAFQYPENNWQFCPETPVKDGLHIINIEATVLKNQTFWFDRIEYVPSPSLSLENKTILVPHTDSEIQYDNGWGDFGDFAKGTQQNGSVMTFNFLGVSISWWGYTPGEFPGNTTTATWQIDDESPQTFLVKGHTDSGGTSYNIKFFETPSYPYGSHRLTVTHKGTGQYTPLNLVSLLIQNGTIPIPTSTPTTAKENSVTTNSTAPIVGGAVAGAVVLVLIILVLFLLRRRKKNASELVSLAHPNIYSNSTISESPGYPVTIGTISPDFSGGKHSRSYSGMTSQTPGTDLTSNTSQYTPSSHGREAGQPGEHMSNPVSRAPLRLHGGPSTLQPLRPKEREILTPQLHVPQPHQSDAPPPFRSPIPQSELPRFVVHHDSGVRLRPQTESAVVDIPPVYTPG